MATTPEGRVKNAVKKLLKAYGCYYHMPVVRGFGKRTLDFIGCHRGRFFAVETKAFNKEMTDQQADIATEMRAAGAAVFRINAESGLDDLETWLESHA